MYHMTPEQIRQRFLLIDQLDFWVPLSVLVFLVFFLILTIALRIRAGKEGDKGWWRVLDFVAHMVGLAAVGYYVWRTFYAFY